MNIVLSSEAARIVEEQVRYGRYPTAEAAVDAAVVHLAFATGDLDDLRAEIEIGVREADAGNFVDFTADNVIAECLADYQVGCGAKQ